MTDVQAVEKMLIIKIILKFLSKGRIMIFL